MVQLLGTITPSVSVWILRLTHETLQNAGTTVSVRDGNPRTRYIWGLLTLGSDVA